MGTTNNSKAYRRLTPAEDRLRLLPEGSLDFFNRRGLEYLGLPNSSSWQGWTLAIHPWQESIVRTGVVMLLEKGSKYG
jgi:hypothetical protein